MISPDQFWNQLKSSGLISPNKIEVLRAKIASKPEIANSTIKIARALVSNKLLSEDEARTLVTGKTPEPPPPTAPIIDSKPSSDAETRQLSPVVFTDHRRGSLG